MLRNKKRNRLISIMIIALCLGGLYWQSTLLSKRVRECDELEVRQVYHYLAIGNSITLHGIADYWWGEWGMAASNKDAAFVNIIKSTLEEKKNSEIESVSYNYFVWEVQAHDRAETWELLDRYLSAEIDLITVQLSENCSDLTTFPSDFESLLVHIRELCGDDTQIIVIDDFWSDEKSEMKRAVCEEMGIAFADLSDIRGKAEYQAGLGKVVYGNDGEPHVIEHEGVAMHPGDKGMEVIAQKVLEKILEDSLK